MWMFETKSTINNSIYNYTDNNNTKIQIIYNFIEKKTIYIKKIKSGWLFYKILSYMLKFLICILLYFSRIT